jgi:hypothetical protein
MSATTSHKRGGNTTGGPTSPWQGPQRHPTHAPPYQHSHQAAARPIYTKHTSQQAARTMDLAIRTYDLGRKDHAGTLASLAPRGNG